MKRMSTTWATILVIISLLTPLPAFAIGPFGGPIVAIFFSCIAGVIEIELGPPTPGLYMYAPGTLSYAFGPPRHPGQWLLGMSGPPVPCIIRVDHGFRTRSNGGLIIFHGSSI